MREFVSTGPDVLRRLSKGTDLGLPSWTITWFEVYFRSFGGVFRGTSGERTVAVKVQTGTTQDLPERSGYMAVSPPSECAQAFSVGPAWALSHLERRFLFADFFLFI